MLNLTTETLIALANDELRQLDEEGRRTSELQNLLEAVEEREMDQRKGLARFWEVAVDAPRRDDFPYHEPSTWDEIERVCSMDASAAPLPDDEPLRDRIHGAWLGRCAGCMLGKPVEGRSRAQIRAVLQAAGEYPLQDYFPAVEDPGEVPYRKPDDPTLRPNITHSVRDDDTDYTLLGLHLMKSYGGDLTAADVGEEWLQRLPYMKTYTAERAAYRNLVLEIPADRVADILNPYREWIGAQIRADAFGYCHPGWPYEAARTACQDAMLSHRMNGIYGEIFFAALIADALVSNVADMEPLIHRALCFVPPQSRFAEMVRHVVRWCGEDHQWETMWERISDQYGAYHPVHTINNAALVIVGLLHAEGDFEEAICATVMGGWDTDCTGATAGSVMGAVLGAENLPEKWTAPLQDTLHSALEGYTVNAISELADETVGVAQAQRGE
ncbi:MAG: ADP-ribosylglycohydrolase family protein [Armatimonadota bacterium]